VERRGRGLNLRHYLNVCLERVEKTGMLIEIGSAYNDLKVSEAKFISLGLIFMYVERIFDKG
jgi:hypothetical protein